MLCHPAGVTEPILEATGLVKRFPGPNGTSVLAVDEVGLVVGEAETHALVGESGSGKTTTGRLLVRLLEPDAGSTRFRGQDLYSLGPGEMRRARRHLQMIFQDPYSSLDPRQPVWRSVAEPWDVHRVHRPENRRARAEELLAKVGVDPALAGRLPARFSGGQRQRIGIARALALEPSLIVCDEPVSSLDLSVQAQILNLLLDLQAELGLSYVLVAHDLAMVRHVATRVSVMHRGRLVETGTRDQIFDHPAHPYTEALLAAAVAIDPLDPAEPAVPGAEEGEVPYGDACLYRDRCPRAGDICAAERPALVERGQGHPVACFFPA